MKLKLLLGGVLLALAAIAAVACAGSLPCPIHQYSTGYFTGTQVIDGILVGVYQCPRGHTFVSRCN